MRLRPLIPIAVALLVGCASADFVGEPQAASPVCVQPRPRDSAGQYTLALSGGGYRAMLFHIGAMWRLHELGLLDQVRVVSSVSGGSIAAGILAASYERIRNDPPGEATCYRNLVADPAVRFATESLDWKVVTASLFRSDHAGNVLSDFLRKGSVGSVKLRDTPKVPSFLFQATNLHTGSVWTFSRQSIGDPQIGFADPRDLQLADAIAASSSFPPVLSPYRISASKYAWTDSPIDPNVTQSREFMQRSARGSDTVTAKLDASTTQKLRGSSIFLTDGGVADNLGLEGVWETRDYLLVSDGGSEPIALETPPTAWITQSIHVTDLIHNQPTQIRSRLLVDGFRGAIGGGRDGAYWAIGKRLPIHRESYFLTSPKASEETRKLLAAKSTRLGDVSLAEAKQLVNLGYHVADWHMPYIDKLMSSFPQHQISTKLPYPEEPLWSGSN